MQRRTCTVSPTAVRATTLPPYKPRRILRFANAGVGLEVTAEGVEDKVVLAVLRPSRRADRSQAVAATLRAALDAHRPDRVSHAIPMGADLRGLLGASAPTLFAASRRASSPPSDERAEKHASLATAAIRSTMTTQGRSRSSRSVSQVSIQRATARSTRKYQMIPHADCVEVTGSHIGLVFNGKVYRVVAEALALLELATD